MENLKLLEVYGAKCNILKEDIIISTRSIIQTDSNVIFKAKKSDSFSQLHLKIKKSTTPYWIIDIYVITKDSNEFLVGCMDTKRDFIDIYFSTDFVCNIKLVIKNTSKEEKEITLKYTT